MRLNTSFKILQGLLWSIPALAQLPETDIYLVKMTNNGYTYHFSDFKNITNRKGYDNQPFFTPDGKELLFVSIREDNQSDVYGFSIKDSSIRKITETKESEYSPTLSAQSKKEYTVVRVDADSGQRLYSLKYKDPSKARLIPHSDSVGYYCRLTDTTIAMFVLGDPPTLQILNTKSGKRTTVASGIGRCMKLIPEKQFMYFVTKENPKQWYLNRLDIKTFKVEKLLQTPDGSEDFAVLPDQRVIMGKDGILYATEIDHWEIMGDFTYYFKNFYRMAINKDGTLMAIVVYTGPRP